MSNALVKIGTTTVQGGSFSDEQVALLKRTIAKGTSDDEFALFVGTAKRLGLDPFARQIFAVKYGSTMSIQVSIDGFRLVADRTDRYAPGQATEYVHENGALVYATAYVKKYVQGQWHEVPETAYLVEYTKSSNPLWKTMPRAMLAKCAEARALRRAFPTDLGGVYIPEEMDQADAAKSISPIQFRPPENVVDVESPEPPNDLVAAFAAAQTVTELTAIAGRAKGKTGEERARLIAAYRQRLTELTEESRGFEEEAAS